MSNNFESLLGDLTARRKGREQAEEKRPAPEKHELTVTFIPGKEYEARLAGDNHTTREAAALLYAAGELLGGELDVDGGELGEAFINTAIRQAAFSGLVSLLDLL